MFLFITFRFLKQTLRNEVRRDSDNRQAKLQALVQNKTDDLNLTWQENFAELERGVEYCLFVLSFTSTNKTIFFILTFS